MHYNSVAWRLAGKQVLSPSLVELRLSAAACISILLLVTTAFLPCTCYPPNLQPTRTGKSNTIDGGGSLTAGRANHAGQALSCQKKDCGLKRVLLLSSARKR
jgi:hypothetical protein